MGRELRARSAAIGERRLAGSRCLRLLAVLVAAFALVGTANAAPTHRSTVIRVPTLLWNTYPLVQRPASSARGSRFLAAGPPPALLLRAEPHRYGVQSKTLLVLLGSLTAAAVGFVLVRSALGEVADEAGRARQRSKSRRRS